MRNIHPLPTLAVAALLWAAGASAQTISVSFPASPSAQPLDGRLLLLLSNDPSEEPRMQINDTPKSQMVFGVTVDGWKPGRPHHHRRQRARISAGAPARCSARRLHHPGRPEYLRNLPPRRRQDHQALGRPRRRQAVEPRARQSDVKAASGSHWARCGADPRTDQHLARPGHSADSARAGHKIHPPHSHPVRAADKVLGTAGLSLGHRSRARRIRHPSQGPLSADRLSRPLRLGVQRLPRDSARSQPEARLLRPLPSRRLQPHPAGGGLQELPRRGSRPAGRAC